MRIESGSERGSFGAAVDARLEGADALTRRIYNGVRGSYGGNFGTADLEDIDLEEGRKTSGFDGSDWRFLNGYGTLTDGLAAALDVRTGVSVREIEWRDSLVRAAADDETFEADLVVSSVPLAVLKRGAITFAPGLPAVYRTAIEGLDFGLSEKFVMDFEAPFWPRDRDVIIRASEDARFSLFFNNHYPASGDAFLTARVLGRNVPAFVELSDEAATDQVMDALKDMFGAGLPGPRRVKRSRWLRDPNSAGAYSVDRLGVPSFDHRSVLAVPVSDRFAFAGEHTHPCYPSTVHGAYLTGKRAAYALLG